MCGCFVFPTVMWSVSRKLLINKSNYNKPSKESYKQSFWVVKEKKKTASYRCQKEKWCYQLFRSTLLKYGGFKSKSSTDLWVTSSTSTGKKQNLEFRSLKMWLKDDSSPELMGKRYFWELQKWIQNPSVNSMEIGGKKIPEKPYHIECRLQLQLGLKPWSRYFYRPQVRP